MSPTKQDRDNSGKEPKLLQVTEWRKKKKKLWEKPGSVMFSASSPLTTNENCAIMIQSTSQVRIRL